MSRRTELTKQVHAGKVRELLTYQDPDNANVTVYDVTAMRQIVKEGRMGPAWHILGVPTSMVNDPTFQYSVDEERINELVLLDTEEDPVFISMTFKNQVAFYHLIDGAHRLHRMYRDGIELAMAICAPDDEIPRATGVHLNLEWGGSVPKKDIKA